ncbi:16S rRNA (adenine(1518)-N(6)/adenine(1519)-N(6))-dimethyltransferase RsmA [Proteiniclasticum sp. QWL-01]|uniref:16S rRNA (adenine(1518)-N(6)/adenine(1519)-N(6))- dimethyltransferase RsmA n=1 Tax=Proteiniclasticum sp. QWL-01 TaxID=3036945 RepID=UPI00220683DA|nr:16S rRNA (adenine(1518)-N(6)/adenine(1519)-N(6))-dimethyltransferase RsmA [Proteiniclasticum sp. QWL-01]UUM11223.1 16S rRNA (adenine(1518)-N(6)/adenine(1519)-N(6))-dimethyltransferase RsmA [Clostridiaceae bacterium HFYG-1003]WFF72563.1 16S rRNA (adenine(1518)-N(6)/adenine(1519)-N(6))-dimethyltransferase RsmA [Proteiniclasticum sp. QWL-01]
MERLNTKELVKKYGFRFTKSLGQNFLVDPTVVRDIIEGSNITKADHVIEIGPGVGTLTRALLEAAGQVTAVEIDSALIPILKEELKNYDNFRLIEGDVLKTDLKALTQGAPVKVVANLPYYVTTPILLRLLEEDFPWQSITIMIQKEVAMRLNAGPGTKDYGSLSVLISYYADTELIRLVTPVSFIPQPKVDSLVIRLDRRSQRRVAPKDEQLFFQLVRQSFAMRRKTLHNTLKPMGIDPVIMADSFAAAGIDPGRRGETLTIEEFARLSDEIKERLGHEENQ